MVLGKRHNNNKKVFLLEIPPIMLSTKGNNSPACQKGYINCKFAHLCSKRGGWCQFQIPFHKFFPAARNRVHLNPKVEQGCSQWSSGSGTRQFGNILVLGWFARASWRQAVLLLATVCTRPVGNMLVLPLRPLDSIWADLTPSHN